MEIIVFNFDYLTCDERDMVQLLDEVKAMSSCTTILLDWGKDNEIDKLSVIFVKVPSKCDPWGPHPE